MSNRLCLFLLVGSFHPLCDIFYNSHQMLLLTFSAILESASCTINPLLGGWS
jgi:hypothetical protein